ncbi:MAG: peptide ligase PGM1-related protein [Pseudomonadota bacterium]
MTQPPTAPTVPDGPLDAPGDFEALQDRLQDSYEMIFADPDRPRTVIVLPSLTLDTEILAKIEGVIHYEQRLLCLFFLLRQPNVHVVYLTSEPIPQAIIDYYLHLLPGIPSGHARRRLTLLSCHDPAARALTEKVLERPRLMARLRAAVKDPEHAHITCFNVAGPERELALRLGVPIYGCDPALLPLGSKSGSRRIFKAAGMTVAAGHEDLADMQDVVTALASLKGADPGLKRAVVKLNEGFSGEGNAIFEFSDAPSGAGLEAWIRQHLHRMRFVASGVDLEAFDAKFEEMGGIVEAFVEGARKRSPSVQYRITPRRELELISTHDQITGGQSGQVFTGCSFPADRAYRQDLHQEAQGAAEALRREGVLGRFGIDFISVPENGGWRHYAVEINLRKGGTTHPFLMLQHLTDGTYDRERGAYRSRSGQNLCYVASDNLQSPAYRGLTADDLIDIAVERGLHFNALTQEGVAFHIIGALSGHGKLGVTCVGKSLRDARMIYRRTTMALSERAAG